MTTRDMYCRHDCLQETHAEDDARNQAPSATVNTDLCIRQSSFEFYRETDMGLLLLQVR